MTQLSTLNKYFKRYKLHFISGIIFVILTNYFRILAPQLTGYVVNSVVTKLKSPADAVSEKASLHNYDISVVKVIEWFNDKPFQSRILYAGLVLLLIAIISGFFLFLTRQTIIVMSRRIEYDQKNEIFAHYQKLDTTFYKTHSTGDMMNRISEDVSRVRMYTGPSIMYFINLAAIIGFSIFFMVRSDLKLTLISLCPLPILAFAIYFVNTIINKKSEKIQALLSDLTTNAQESYSGIRVIKSFVQEKAMLGFFKKNSEAYRNNSLSLAQTEAIYFPSMGLLIGLSTLITVMAGMFDVVHGVPNAAGKIVEFVLYIQMLTFPVSAIGLTASMTQRAVASQRRINEFLLTSPVIKDAPSANDVHLQGNISFSNIDFIYPHTGIHAIKNFSLEIKKGQKIAVVGKTGSGKSTIAQLMLRMYDAQSGTLTYDGIDIKQIKTNSIRSQISYVPQDVFLFSETVKNNIRFGKKDATDEEVYKAAEQASIYNEIKAFDEGFETMVGERGVTLSGGQKQRISIARALIKKPELVIFDDCLSAVDARTENQILGNLYEYLQDKTAVIITHRIFSLFNFDKIVVLDDGEIAEQGTHAELITKKGLYSNMYAKQQENDSAGNN